MGVEAAGPSTAKRTKSTDRGRRGGGKGGEDAVGEGEE